MDAVSIVPENVLTILTKLDPQEGHGLDDIHPRILKLFKKNFFATPRANIFNLALTQGNVST